jgi:TolB-like protein/Tfp pilus assembly protein PilF
MTEFLVRLKQRKLVQWALAYLAGAWALLQVLEMASGSYGWPAFVMRLAFGLAVLGSIVTLVLAWYHGERGMQKVSGTELLLIALVLAVGGTLVWRSGTQTPAADENNAAAKTEAPVSAVPAKSIAVLPFENLSADKDNEYFVAGMQDLILTKLAGIGDLKVISRTSTRQYGSRPQNLKDIARQLGVAKILEGSVQKAGNQVLVNVQLIDAGSDEHLWAESYQRTLDNIFGVEGEVADKIASALHTTLSPAQGAQLAAVPTTNKAAYDAFLHAEFNASNFATSYDTGNMKAAIPLYREAIAEDPRFALAWARLSTLESGLAWFGGGGLDLDQLRKEAEADADEAVKLAPEAAATQLALGNLAYFVRNDYAAGLIAFDAVLASKPNDTDALAARAYALRRLGRFDEAIASLEKAFVLDPRNSRLAYTLGETCMMVERYPEAEDWFRRALAIDPRNSNAKNQNAHSIVHDSGDIPRALAGLDENDDDLKLTRISLLTYQRRYAEALALLEGIVDTPGNFGFRNPKALWQADILRLMGDTARARSVYERELPQIRERLGVERGIRLAEIWQNVADCELALGHVAEGLDAVGRAQAIDDESVDRINGPGDTIGNAALYVRAGRNDLAIPLLAKALDTPGIGFYYSPVLLWIDPAWDAVRDDPRFQALLRKYEDRKPAILPPAAASVEDRNAHG